MRRFRALGPNFRLLGVTFDPQLLMHDGTRKIAVEAGWRLQAILRPRRFFTTPEVVRLYEAPVVSYVESGTPAYYHAAPSVLDCINRVQRRFLRALTMSDVDALVHFRLAPLETRRDIAILGLLHRVNLGLVSKQIEDLFPKMDEDDRIATPSLAGSALQVPFTTNSSLIVSQHLRRYSSRVASLGWCNATMCYLKTL